MNKKMLLIALKNLGWLVLVALPAFFLLVWIQVLIEGAQESRNLRYVLETGAFYYLVYILYVALGGGLYQALLLLLPVSLNPVLHRTVAVLLTSVIPLLLVLLGERPQTIMWFPGPMILTLGAYGFLIRLPRIPDEDTILNK